MKMKRRTPARFSGLRQDCPVALALSCRKSSPGDPVIMGEFPAMNDRIDAGERLGHVHRTIEIADDGARAI